MSTRWHKFTHQFWGRFRDFGTGRLPANSELNNRRYLIITTIGKGGMGAVYLAHDTRMNYQQVAIKEMSQARLLDARALHRARQSFQQEAEMLARLQHPNLPKVYTSFQENNRSYLVMEYIQGKTLAETLQQGNTFLSVSSVVEYDLQLSSVLTYLHTLAQPIMYLDLKPPNIMLRKGDGHVFLIDFGIARRFQAGQLLVPEEVFFTPGYAPPEQMAGQPEPRSDLFALGATLHQCLTRQNPQAHTREHIFDFPPAQPFNPQVPDTLSILVDQMLSVDRGKRPASAAVVQRELKEMQKGLIPSFVLTPQTGTVDHNAITYPPGQTYPSKSGPSSSHTNNWARVALLFPQLVQQGQRLVVQGQKGVVPLLVTSVRKPWKQASALVGNQKIWDQRFAALLGLLFVLTIGSSLALLKTAPDATHIHILGLLLMGLVLGIIGFHLSGKRLYDPVPRAILALMGLALLVSTLALQGLPDIEAAMRPLIQNATFNQLCILGLLVSAALCLARPEDRLAWVDHLLLGTLAACCALLQYSFGQNELAQFSALPSNLIQYINPSLTWSLFALALLAFLLIRRAFGGVSRFGLMLVVTVFTALQYTSGFNEFQSFRLSGAPLIILSFAYTWIPPLCAVLACLARRTWLTRAALCTLTLAEATMLSYQGQHVFFPFAPASPYPLSINILAFSTLYQLLDPALVLIVLLALLRLPGKNGFRWLDHGLLLLGSFVCARLNDAFWQVPGGLSAPNMDQATMYQQYIVLARLIPAYLIYGLLIAFPLALCAITACHFWRQSHPYARIDPWLRRFQALLILIDRLLTLSILSIAFLLASASGIFALTENQLFTGSRPDIFSLITLLLCIPLAILALILAIRLLRRKTFMLGNSERLTLFFSVLICLLFVWQEPQIAALPLLEQHIQFTGNIFHWSNTALHLLILGGLVCISCLALFWLRRSFFVNYRSLLNLLFFLLLVCAFLQVNWPIFLPLALLFLIPGILLAVQIEKAG